MIANPGHMPKIAASPYMVKTAQKSSPPEPAGRFSLNLVCSIWDSSSSVSLNDDPRMTLTYFTARSILQT